MDTQTIFAVAGIATTVLLGIWAIVITVRYNKSVQITYAHDLAIALTDDITQNFPNLRVLFHSQPVSDNLVLLKGYFINTGKKDISHEMIEKHITLTLPTEFEWVECKVVERSPSLKATANLTGKTEISLETGLWKTREYLKVEALAKVPVVKVDQDNFPRDNPTDRLLNALTFPHRIADSKTVRMTRVPQLFQKPSALKFLGFPLPFTKSSHVNLVMAIVLIVIGMSTLAVGHFLPHKALGYRLTIDGQERVMSVYIKHDKVILQDKGDFKKEYTLSEFDNVSSKHPAFVTNTDRFLTSLGLAYTGFGILMLLILGVKGIRENRLLAMITSKKKT
jgi:hypothetical protein